MFTRQNHKALGEPAETDGIRRVLEHFGDGVIGRKFFAVEPHVLLHQERIIIKMLFLDRPQPMKNVIVTELNVVIEESKKLFDVAVGFEGELGQIDGNEGEVAARAGLFGAVEIGHHARSTAHRCDARVIIAGLIILKIIRRVDVDEIGEEAARADAAGLNEEVVIGVGGIVIDARLQLKDADGENGRFAVAEPGVDGVKDFAGGEAPFGGSIHAVIDRTEGDLSAGARVECIEIMNERLHGLMSFLLDVLASAAINFFRQIFAADDLLDRVDSRRIIIFGVAATVEINFIGVENFIDVDGGALELGADCLNERLTNALGHGVIESVNGLPAEHIILIGLDCDASERGVGADRIGLAEEAVTGGEAAVEEFQEIDLAAIESDQRKILIVDMNEIIAVGVDEALGEDVIIDEKLCALGAELEHDAHRRVCIDIGVIALEIDVLGVGEEDISIDFH